MDENFQNVVSSISGTAETTATPSTSVDQSTPDANVSGENLTNSQTAESGSNQTEVSDTDSKAVDNAIPYSRFQEVNSRLRQVEAQAKQDSQELSFYRELSKNPQMLNQYVSQNAPQVDPQTQEAKETLKSLGFLPMDEIDKRVEAKLNDTLMRREMTSQMTQKFESVEKKYDGKNGLPKADREELKQFMQENNVFDPEYAYKLKYEDAIIDHRVKEKRSAPFTEKPGQPMQTAGTDKKALLDEATKNKDFETYFKRTGVLDAIMPKRG